MPKRSRSARVFAPPVHRIPRISTSPRSGAVSPSRISMVVVFPAPLGPSRPKHSRALTVRSSSAIATTPAYRLVSPTQRMGGAGKVRSGRLLRLRWRRGVLHRSIKLHVDAVHSIGQPADFHVDSAAATGHDRHGAGNVGDRPDVGRERPLPHLGCLIRDSLAQLLNRAGLARPVPLELGDEVLQMIGRTPVLLDLLDAPELVGGELWRRHGPLNSARRALRL